MILLKRLYVFAIRALAFCLRKLGILRALERSRSPIAVWFRSLFAIYDFEDLVHLDLPWWTFEAIDTVEEFLAQHPNARVFEWGSGASTVWLANRAREVISVEHDAIFAEKVQDFLKDRTNVQLTVSQAEDQGNVRSGKSGYERQFFDAYVSAIGNFGGQFDLIVIDGRAREKCLEVAVPRLADGGIIVFDNAGRSRYWNGLNSSGLPTKLTRGLTVGLPYPDSTAILTN